MPLDQLVVLACFGATPTLELIRERVTMHAVVLRVDDRVCLASQLAARKPAVVFFPLVDCDGTTTLPLIERLLHDIPATQVVVCVPPGSITQGLARALTLNAQLLAWATNAELAHGINALLAPAALAPEESRALDAMLSGLQPAAMAAVLLQCAALAHHRLTVSSLAAALGVSPRTLNRATKRAGWPTPSELISLGRVMRASTVRSRGTASAATVARLSGFGSMEELTASLHRWLGSSATVDDLAPVHVSRAVRRRIGVAGSTTHVSTAR
jgi:AraC-like DNA-binding protein